MNCPHGKKIHAKNHYGMSLYFHEDGTGCQLLNQLETNCEHLADTYISDFIDDVNIDDIRSNGHLMRTVYSAYKVSVLTRFHYIEFLNHQSPEAFAKGFDPIYYALISEDDYATSGLYLLELYFAFYGITERITSVNTEVTESALYNFLSESGVQSTVEESAITRSYAHMLRTQYGSYKDAFTVPKHPHGCLCNTSPFVI